MSLYSAADYLSALKALLPPGRAIPAEPGSTQEQVLAFIAASLARTDQAAGDLLVESFPATSDDLLPEWEETTGLPDPCAGVSPTLQQRQAQVQARFANSGGQSASYMIAYAARLGFEVSIKQFAPFRVGFGRAGQAIAGVDWAFTWAVQAPLVSLTQFRAGRSAAGEPLQAFGNAMLECELRAVAPAHTVLLFTYS